MSGFDTQGHMSSHGEPVAWSDEQLSEIAQILERYPEKRAATLPLLWMAQRSFGWISYEVCRLVGTTLDLPPSHVLSVATFYTMYKKAPTGKHLIQVCHTLSCALAGSERVVATIRDKLGIREGETTADGTFTLMRVECLAACGAGPMMQIDDDFHELLDDDKVHAILDALAEGRTVDRPELDQWVYSTPAS